MQANSVPNGTLATTGVAAQRAMQSRWQTLDGIMYRGFPVYVNKIDGAMVYEQDYERLVSLPEEAEEAIVDILMQDFDHRSMIEAGMLTVRGRAN